MKLTTLTCKNAKPKEKLYKLFDGNGLFLEIKANGNKYWRVKYRFHGKEKTYTIGSFPEISLSDARLECQKAKGTLKKGLDPSTAKIENKKAEKLKSENSFEAISIEWLDNMRESWTEGHYQDIKNRLENHIFPEIGHRPIAEIKTSELLYVLRNIEAKGLIDMPKRMRQTCGQIFRYAIITERAENNPAESLRGVLKAQKKTHYNKFEENDLPEFLKRLEACQNSDLQSKIGLKLILLTFVRTIEMRAARWEEINFDKKQWHIPLKRMKTEQKHIVPLSKQVIAEFRELQKLNGWSEYVFPNKEDPNTYTGANAFLDVIYNLGYKGIATVHGMRSTASTILNERGFNSDFIERQLAHTEKNKVRAAYNHAQYLPQRAKMMQEWADHIDELKKKSFKQL